MNLSRHSMNAGACKVDVVHDAKDVQTPHTAVVHFKGEARLRENLSRPGLEHDNCGRELPHIFLSVRFYAF